MGYLELLKEQGNAKGVCGWRYLLSIGNVEWRSKERSVDGFLGFNNWMYMIGGCIDHEYLDVL
jgi:hypothetical protein